MAYKFLILYLLINLNLIISIFSIKLGDPNVCSKKKIMTDNKSYKKTSKCWKEETLTRYTCLSELREKFEKTEAYCCNGYIEKDNKCEATCPQGCVHGDCVSVGLCENCALSFGGLDCNQTCPNGRFGLNCENDCNCILDPNCNKNYKICFCNLNSIENECKEICKCRSKCKIGLIGKNCDLKCPDYKFGDLCLNDCLCNRNGTEFCNNETGECECLENYYGIHCERYCSGNLKCTSHKNCICEKTIEQSIIHLTNELEKVTNELEKVTNQSKTNKNNFEKNIDRLIMHKNNLEDEIGSLKMHKNNLEDKVSSLKLHKNIIVILFISLIIILFLIILKINFRTKKIKNQLKSISIRYSNNGNDQFNNQIYETNLETDFNKNNSNDNLKNLTDQSKFLQKFDILTKNLFKKKDQSENNYPNLIVENSDIYSTISDNEKIDDKINEDRININ